MRKPSFYDRLDLDWPQHKCRRCRDTGTISPRGYYAGPPETCDCPAGRGLDFDDVDCDDVEVEHG